MRFPSDGWKIRASELFIMLSRGNRCHLRFSNYDLLFTNEIDFSSFFSYYYPSTSCFLCTFFETANCNLFINNMLWVFFQKETFLFLFFSVVRFSPPSQETEAVSKKGGGKKHAPDLQESTFDVWLQPRAKPEAALGFSVSFVVRILSEYPILNNECPNSKSKA